MSVERLWLVFFLAGCQSWIQSPTVHYCLENKNLYIGNIIITNATLGQYLSLNYTVEFMRRIQHRPRLDLIMAAAGGPQIPCVDNIGSCMYRLCNAETEIEAQITDTWRNECPIPRGLYNGYFRYRLGHTAWNILQGRAVLIRANLIEGGELLACFRLAVMIRPF